MTCAQGLLRLLWGRGPKLECYGTDLVTRIQKHVPNGKPNQESDVAKHLVCNPNHKINFDSPEILGHSNNRRKLRIKETLLIQKNSTAN